MWWPSKQTIYELCCTAPKARTSNQSIRKQSGGTAVRALKKNVALCAEEACFGVLYPAGYMLLQTYGCDLPLHAVDHQADSSS